MQANRVFGAAALLETGVCAPTIDSRNGNATVAPFRGAGFGARVVSSSGTSASPGPAEAEHYDEALVRIWNCGVLTTFTTSDENLYRSGAAACVIDRTAGMSSGRIARPTA
jgi:hypothetical protein